MATVTDNFDRADSTNLGSNWSERSGTWEILSNTLRQGTSTGAYRKLEWIGAALDSANNYSQVSGRGTNSARGFGAFARGSVGSTVTYYAAVLFPGDNDYLVEITAGAEGILDTGSARSTSTTYTVRIEANGSSLRTLIGGVESCTATDATLTSGSVGVMTYGACNGTNDWIDDFSAGDLAITITATGIATGEAFGTQRLDQSIVGTGIATGETFGSATVSLVAGSQEITPSGIAGAEVFGSARLDQSIAGTGITTAAAFGTARLDQSIAGTGIAAGEAFGSAALQRYMGVFGVPAPGKESGYGLRFYGHVAANQSKVRIPLDNPSDPVIDVGAGDFTYEFWMRAAYADNTSSGIADARYSNIILDRDIWGHPRGWVLGVTRRTGPILAVCWAVADTGGGWATTYGTADVGDNAWHHVALTWRQSTRVLECYVDGVSQGTRTISESNLSYPNGERPVDGVNNEYLVIGGEKHGVGVAYNGYFDEFRISDTRRYTAGFTRPSTRFEPDADTVGLFHCDDGSGTVLADQSGAAAVASNGELLVGGTPSGPEWAASDAPISTTALGTPRLDLVLTMTGIGTGEAFGSARLDQTIVGTGITTGEAVGEPLVQAGDLALVAIGIASAESFGSARLDQDITAASIATGEAVGGAALAVYIAPGGIATGETFGTAEVQLDAGQAITAAGILTGEAFGAATVQPGAVSILPAGVAGAEAFGAVAIIGGVINQVSARRATRSTPGSGRTRSTPSATLTQTTPASTRTQAGE